MVPRLSLGKIIGGLEKRVFNKEVFDYEQYYNIPQLQGNSPKVERYTKKKVSTLPREGIHEDLREQR